MTVDTYVSPTDVRSQEETHVADTMAHLFIAGVVAAKAADWSGLARRWSERGYSSGDFDREVTRKFTDVFWHSAGSMLLRAAGVGRRQAIADFEVELPTATWKQAAMNWAQVYGHEMSKQVAKQSELAISQAVPQMVNRGIRGDGLALMVKGLYGLDPRSMNSAINFLGNDKKPRDKTVIDLTTQLLSGRAKIIGDVQSFTALNFGRQLTYMEAQDSGLLPRSARKVWVTAIDERVCPVCRPMDGRSVGLTDFFELHTKAGKTRLLVPPVHPNCRCTIVPQERYESGLITATARFLDKGPPEHKGKLRQEIEDLVLSKAFDPSRSADVVEKFDSGEKRDQYGRWAKDLNSRESRKLKNPDNALADVFVLDNEVIEDTNKWIKLHGKESNALVHGVNRWVGFPGVAQARRIIEADTIEEARSLKDKFFKKNERGLLAVIRTLDAAPKNAPTLYRGISLPSQKALDDLKVGQRFDCPLGSYSESSRLAAHFARPPGQIITRKGKKRAAEKRSVVFVLAPGAKALHVAPVAKNAAWRANEWISRGTFEITKIDTNKETLVEPVFSDKVEVTKVYIKQVDYKPISKSMPEGLEWVQILLSLPLVHGLSEVQKFSPEQPRDNDGKFVAYEAAKDPLLMKKPKGLIKPKPAKADLNRYHKGVDNRLKKLPTGTYVLPRSYLEAHARGWGVRLGQENHMRQLTNKLAQEGFDRKKPITLYVYNDAAFLRDGAHRLEAAYRLDMKKVPVRVVRIKSDYEPFHRGVGGWLNERKTERVRRQVSRRGKYTKPIVVEPKPWDDVITQINRHLIERGQVSH